MKGSDAAARAALCLLAVLSLSGCVFPIGWVFEKPADAPVSAWRPVSPAEAAHQIGASGHAAGAARQGEK